MHIRLAKGRKYAAWQSVVNSGSQGYDYVARRPFNYGFRDFRTFGF